MFGKITYNILGSIVGLTIIVGSWAIAIGIGWLITKIFAFIFATIPYSESIIWWAIAVMVSIPVLLISQVVGSNIIQKYIRIKQ